MALAIRIRVNGDEHELLVEPRETLAEVLRERLHFIGLKNSCDVGVCGACTIILNGVPVSSCLMLASDVDGCEVTTIEGLSGDGGLHPLQVAFVEKGAVQCGYCTSGMIMMALALLEECPNPTIDEVRSYMSGNLCRCTGYKKIWEAILAAPSTASKTRDEIFRVAPREEEIKRVDRTGLFAIKQD